MPVRSQAGRWVWRIALIAFCLQISWVPAHLAFEAHHGHGPHAAVHTHDGDGHQHGDEPGHEPHSASDHTVDLTRSPVLGSTVVLSRPDTSVVALAAASAASRVYARRVDERPRARPPDPSVVRGPPAR